MKIGILGARGMVGSGALCLLHKMEVKAELLLGGRDILKVKETAEYILSTRIKWNVCQVDLTDRQQCRAFCEQCQMVLDCSGPVCEVGYHAMECCADLAVDYISVSGDTVLYEHIRSYKKSLKSLCMFSAGISPGLTELLPFYYSPKEEEIVEEYIGGHGFFSQSAIKDILAALISNGEYSAGMGCELSGGLLVQAKRKWIVQDYKGLVGKQMAVGIITKDFQRAMESAGHKNVKFFDSLTFSNLKLPPKLNDVTAEQIQQKYVAEAESNTVIILRRGEKELKITFNGGGETLSGMLAAAVVCLYLKRQITKKGIQSMYQCVEISDLLKLLSKIGEEDEQLFSVIEK